MTTGDDEAVLQMPKLSRAEALAQHLESRIENEALGSGYRIGTKEDLKIKYGVANGTVSEAIRLLSARRSIEVRPGAKGGIFVAAPAPLVRLGRKMLELSGESVSVADALAVRHALESLVVLDATRHRTAGDVAELRQLTERMAVEGIDMAEYLQVNWRLHRRLAEISPNQILQTVYASLLDYVETRIQRVTPVDGASPTVEGPGIHAELVDAVASGDITRAERASAAHATLIESRPGG